MKAEKTDTVIETEIVVNAEFDLVTAEELVRGQERENPVGGQDPVIEKDVPDQEIENQVGGQDPPGTANGGQDLSSGIGIDAIEHLIGEILFVCITKYIKTFPSVGPGHSPCFSISSRS